MNQTQTAHTPGPWTVSPGNGKEADRIYILADTNAENPTAPFQSIGWVFNQHEANAHLIAAAPALLDALEAAVESMRIMQQQLVGCAAWLKDTQPYVAEGTRGIAEQSLVDIEAAREALRIARGEG